MYKNYQEFVGEIRQQPSTDEMAGRLAAPFAAKQRRLERSEGINALQRKLAESSRTEAEAAVAAMKEQAGRRDRPQAPARSSARIEEMLVTHSTAATRTPPYDYDFRWDAQNGSGSVDAEADKNAGTITTFEGPDDGASATSAAVGIYFHPPARGVGVLNISSDPAYRYGWDADSVFDGSHSDGWLGIYVGAYDLGGTFLRAPIDEQFSLWDETHNGISWNSDSGSSDGYPLNAGMFVNDDEFYAIWVWAGGSAGCFGDHTFYGSYASGWLNLSVPFIHIEYFGGDG